MKAALDLRSSQLPPATCDVWVARPADAHRQLVNLLDPSERERLATLRQPTDRDRRLAAYGLVRLALARYLRHPPAAIALSRDCWRCGVPHGKPRLASPESGQIEFSITHGGDWVAVAFTPAMPVGIDVERIHPEMSLTELTPLVLTSGERAAFELLGHERQCEGFSVYWVRKEAVLKATGFGLTLQLGSFEVTGPGRPPRLLSWPTAPALVGQLTMHDLALGPGHVASVAVIGPCSRVRTWDGSALLASWRGVGDAVR
jgi:4'-phosphopantetheinyl transferase